MRALKIYDREYSSGRLGVVEHDRIKQQLRLKGHNCQSLVQIYEGDRVEDRLYLLMNRAPGTELEKHLRSVPRNNIRGIVRQVAQACLFLSERRLCHRDVKAANIFVSDDFDQATLLDISVIRDIHDPIGVGTDHEGQLPVLATARYCPPEYLFRLIEPGPELWHALTVYQLGGLLHDLIMRTPLFQAEYEQSATNRYRFAWLVATKIPEVRAADVDEDLVFLANRALDKDWKRRSEIRIEDFLLDSTSQRRQAFEMFGLRGRPIFRSNDEMAIQQARLRDVAANLKKHLIRYFQENGVTATHEILPSPHGDRSREIKLQWDVPEESIPNGTVTFQLTLHLLSGYDDLGFRVDAMLSKGAGKDRRKVCLALPEIPDSENSEAIVADQAESAFATMAIELLGVR